MNASYQVEKTNQTGFNCDREGRPGGGIATNLPVFCGYSFQ
jgi:hypothetical protein